MRKYYWRTSLLVLFVVFFLGVPGFIFAASGGIDATHKYAWSENIGWINFGASGSNVVVSDSAITGYAWSESYGWINLSPSGSGVTNNGSGNLSGQAWGENVGWIDFDEVSLDNNTGEFKGYATGPVVGRISFNCSNTNSCSSSNFKVKTTWQMLSPGGGGGGGAPGVPVASPLPPLNVVTVVEGGGGSGGVSSEGTEEVEPPYGVQPRQEKSQREKRVSVIDTVTDFLGPLIPDFLKPEQREEKSRLQQSLPPVLGRLVEKIPQLGALFEKVGIRTAQDVAKLESARIRLPGLKEIGGTPPSELIFVKIAGKRLDLRPMLEVTQNGAVVQTIKTVIGKPLHLTIKPQERTRSVRGFVVFKGKRGVEVSSAPPLSNLLASLYVHRPEVAQDMSREAETDESFVLVNFEYTDPDGDGIYTADIDVPAVPGGYEIITYIDYEDPTLGVKQVKMQTVVDPEGYVYEESAGKETRIPNARVSLYAENPETGEFELWPAKEFLQENPQITDVTGRYSFLVPEGRYYLRVEGEGHKTFQSESFEAQEGDSIHMNIKVRPDKSILEQIDWKMFVVILILFLLITHFYRDWTRKKV